MRVACVCADPGVPVFGLKGSSLHVQEVIRALRQLGASVELFATRLSGEPPADLTDLVIHSLPAVSRGDSAAREQACLAANGPLHEALFREGPFDLVYERYSLWSFAGMQYAREMGIPGLLEVNAPLIEEQAEYRGLVDRRGAEQVAERVFGDATALIAVSRGVRAYLERFPSVRGRVHVVGNGVNPQRFPLGMKPSLPRAPELFRVGFVGTLKPWHGLPVLIEAFARLHDRGPNTRLLVVGDGPERQNLMGDLAARGLLKAADFRGAVPMADVPGLLASMDAAVAPYPQRASFYFSPLKLYEYMAAGLPVVASRVGDLSELIEDSLNGLLCPPGDPIELAAALDRLRREPELRNRLGRIARETVLRSHTWEAVASRILRIAGLAVAPTQRCNEEYS
jgi:glycosyltransferase involved in cell wall biosynthesis